jgi:polyhydroxyalkanoate synthesis repressor PhaR
MVFQVPDNQIIATTVEDDVAFGPENLGVPDAELAGRVREALLAVGLWNERGREPHQLSAGQKQRLAIAGVLAMRPACVVLDEATSLLDPQGRADVLAAVRRLQQAGTTVITITHRMAEVTEAERVVVLEHGRIALQGTPRQVLTQIIVDEEARGATMLPLNFLKQLIGLYGNSMQNFVPQYLEAAMDSFQRNQSAVRDAFGGNVLADIAKRNVAMFEEAAQAFTGKKPAPVKPSSSDVDELKAELAALQAKVDRLSR